MTGFRVIKTDMARVVVQALLNLPALPAVDHPEVVNRVRRGTVESLSRHHAMAVRALNSAKDLALPVDAPPPGLGWQLSTSNEFYLLRA